MTKKLIPLSALLLAGGMFLNSCSKDMDSPTAIMPMKTTISADAHPAITFVGTTTSHSTTYNTIAVMDSDGTDQANVYTAASSSTILNWPTWSGDGSNIAFKDGSYTLKKVAVSVVSGKAVGGTVTTLVTTNTGSPILCAAYSPSTTSSSIAYGTYTSSSLTSTVYTIPSSGGSATQIYSLTGCGIYGVTWNPDASKIAVYCRYWKPRNGGTQDTVDYTCIKILNTSGTLLDSIGIDKAKGLFGSFEWSRTGADNFAYTAMNVSSNGLEFVSGSDSIYTQGASASSTPTFVTTGTYPTWSPSNWKLAYLPHSGGGTKSIIIASGTTATISTSGGHMNWKR